MKQIFLSFLVFLLFASLPAAWGLTVLRLNLEQLTALSEKVFVGKCISSRHEQDDQGRGIERATFEVVEMIKGEPEERIGFKQLDSSPEGIAGELPHYRVGEEMVIFLSEEGRLGLTAPVGLQQGKFKVETVNGEKKVINGVNNRGLFQSYAKSPRYKSMSLTSSEIKLLKTPEGHLPYKDFLSIVRRLANP